MTMVDEGAAGPRPADGPELATRLLPTVTVPCFARPGSGLAHLDGRCQCFFGGPAPVFLVGTQQMQLAG
jgi:hypothetical protein